MRRRYQKARNRKTLLEALGAVAIFFMIVPIFVAFVVSILFMESDSTQLATVILGLFSSLIAAIFGLLIPKK